MRFANRREPSSRRSGRSGPGLILAASIVGTGELINTTGLGAKAGFALLWLILLSCVIKVFVQVELGRYAITHGKTTLAAFDTLPGPRLGTSWICWLWLIMMLITQAQIAAMEGTVGQAAHMAFPRRLAGHGRAAGEHGPVMGHVPGHAAGVFLGRHDQRWRRSCSCFPAAIDRLEKITTMLVAAVTLFTVASVVILQWTSVPDHACPTWSKRLHLRLSRHRAGPGVLGLRDHRRGGLGAGRLSLLVHREGLCARGRTPDRGRRLGPPRRGWIRVMQLDAWFSMVVFTIATVAFYLLGAAVLHPQGLDPRGSEMIPTLSQMYIASAGRNAACRPAIVHAGGLPARAPGPCCSRRSTSPRPPTAGSRPTSSTSSGIWRHSRPRRTGTDRSRSSACSIRSWPWASITPSASPRALIKAGGIAQALMLPLIAGATLYLRKRDADRRVGPTFLTDILTWLAFFGISAVAVYSVFGLLQDLYSMVIHIML